MWTQRGFGKKQREKNEVACLSIGCVCESHPPDGSS